MIKVVLLHLTEGLNLERENDRMDVLVRMYDDEFQ
jgi:hypothetical protein